VIPPGKAAGAFRTIGELAADTGLEPHILRYWESKFPQLRPVTRAGGRRYYRPEDVALVRRIQRLLGDEGYTVRGVRKLLDSEAGVSTPVAAPAGGDLWDRLRAIRDGLRAALDAG
jgi:DNA-binding transcriptional MerR regulator